MLELEKRGSRFNVHADFLHSLLKDGVEESWPGRIGAAKETGVKLPCLPHGHIDDRLVTSSEWSLFTFALDRVRIAGHQREWYQRTSNFEAWIYVLRVPCHASEVTKGLDVAKPIEKFFLPRLETHVLGDLVADISGPRGWCALLLAAGSV